MGDVIQDLHFIIYVEKAPGETIPLTLPIVVGVQSWWSKLKKYSKEETNFTTWEDFANPNDFPVILSDFLYSPLGSNFKSNFRFYDELLCNQAAPKIKVSDEYLK